MLKDIIDLLNSSDWYIGDEYIDIAKGKNKAPFTKEEFKEFLRRNKRRK